MNSIKFRIAAKTDVGLVRTNNEDNFQASSDLSSDQMRWVNNEICSLGNKGALIVVADGMGGMNAGEVASELAIQTIREYFSPEKLTPDVMKSRFSIEKYMNEAIVVADARIKAEARVRPETKGMGTTIVIGWILEDKLYVSWCGDSRAYVYNPASGLHQISKDHSYVQGLVDKGSLTREEAFDFPDSNIITRCLSDASTKAKPESLLKPYEICNNDIIMLCTDGLCGMLRDSEMESLIRGNEHNMDTLVDDLIKAACDAEGSDNITICLCQILQGGHQCNPNVFIDYDKRLNGNKDNIVHTIINKTGDITPKDHRFWYIGLACLVIAIIGFSIWWFMPSEKDAQIVEDQTQTVETPVIEVPNNQSQQMTEEKSQEGVTVDERVEQKITQEENPEKKETAEVPNSGIFGKNNKKDVNKEAEAEVKDQTSQEDNDVLTIIPESPETNVNNDIELQDYLIQNGDTYSALAKKFNTSVEILQKLNNNVVLKEGDVIKVPKK